MLGEMQFNLASWWEQPSWAEGHVPVLWSIIDQSCCQGTRGQSSRGMALQYRPKDTERDEGKLRVINRIILSGAAMYLLIDSQHIFSGLKHLFLSSWLLFYDRRWWRKATWCDEAWVCTHHLGQSWLERWLSECYKALCSLPPLAKLWPSIRAAWPFVTMFMIKDHRKSCTSLLSQYKDGIPLLHSDSKAMQLLFLLHYFSKAGHKLTDFDDSLLQRWAAYSIYVMQFNHGTCL